MEYFEVFSNSSSSTVIAALVSGVVAWAISVMTLKTQRRLHLHSQLSEMISYSIEYPYLEDEDYCAAWDPTLNKTEQDQRYENYCCFVFNFLEHTYDFHRGNRKRISRFIGAEEIVLLHQVWWHKSQGNVKGYRNGFAAYVNRLIADHNSTQQKERERQRLPEAT